MLSFADGLARHNAGPYYTDVQTNTVTFEGDLCRIEARITAHDQSVFLPSSSYTYDHDYILHSLTGCSVAYPCDYAYASNYVARVRVYLHRTVTMPAISNQLSRMTGTAILISSARSYMIISHGITRHTDTEFGPANTARAMMALPLCRAISSAIQSMSSSPISSQHTGWCKCSMSTHLQSDRHLILALRSATTILALAQNQISDSGVEL